MKISGKYKKVSRKGPLCIFLNIEKHNNLNFIDIKMNNLGLIEPSVRHG